MGRSISDLAKQMQKLIANTNGSISGGFAKVNINNFPVQPGSNNHNCIEATVANRSCTNTVCDKDNTNASGCLNFVQCLGKDVYNCGLEPVPNK